MAIQRFAGNGFGEPESRRSEGTVLSQVEGQKPQLWALRCSVSSDVVMVTAAWAVTCCFPSFWFLPHTPLCLTLGTLCLSESNANRREHITACLNADVTCRMSTSAFLFGPLRGALTGHVVCRRGTEVVVRNEVAWLLHDVRCAGLGEQRPRIVPGGGVPVSWPADRTSVSVR